MGFQSIVITHRNKVVTIPICYGCGVGYGTSWCVNPEEEMIGNLMTQRLWGSVFLALHQDFWTLAYQAIDN